MSHKPDELFNNFITKPGVTTEAAFRACAVFDLKPPGDYLAVLQFTNGGEGFERKKLEFREVEGD